MAIFTGQQGYIPRMDMRAATLPGQLIGQGLADIGKAIERYRADKEAKAQAEDERLARKALYTKLGASDEESEELSKSKDLTPLAAKYFTQQKEAEVESQRLADAQARSITINNLLNPQQSYVAQGVQEVGGISGFDPSKYLQYEQSQPQLRLPDQVEIDPLSIRQATYGGGDITTTTTPGMSMADAISAIEFGEQQPSIELVDRFQQMGQAEQPAFRSLGDFEPQITEADLGGQVAQIPLSSARTKEDAIRRLGDLATTKEGKEAIKGLPSEKDLAKADVELDKANAELEQLNLKNAKLEAEMSADQKSALTADQAQRLKFVSGMMEATRQYEAVRQRGYDPTTLPSQAINKSDWTSAYAFKNPDGRAYWDSAKAWAMNGLRDESGAAIGIDEIHKYLSSYFPVLDDTDEVVANKAKRRAIVEKALATGLEVIIDKNRKEAMFYNPATESFESVDGSKTEAPKGFKKENLNLPSQQKQDDAKVIKRTPKGKPINKSVPNLDQYNIRSFTTG